MTVKQYSSVRMPPSEYWNACRELIDEEGGRCQRFQLASEKYLQKEEVVS